MGLCLGKNAPPCWPDLPPEIAGEILSHLPTHHDRLSFKAVCRGWRLAARQQGPLLPPAVPCINLGRGAYQSIVSSKVRRRRRLRFGAPKDFHLGATFGGWVMYERRHSGRSFLCDPFSPSPASSIRAIVLHEQLLFAVKKIMVCSPRLVLAMTSISVLIDASADSACFRPETTVVLWERKWDCCYKDIAFHRGRIFAVNSKEHLFSHCLVGDDAQSPRPSNLRENFVARAFFKDAIKEGPAIPAAATQSHHHLHLVTSSDEQKLLMVRWSIPYGNYNEKMNLQVFEAELDEGRWSEVKDLGGQVLFVGQAGSRAFSAQGSSEQYYGGNIRGGNRVFILGHDWALAQRMADNVAPNRSQKLANGVPSYCVYDMVTGETSLVSLNGGHGARKSSKAEWFFPSV